MSIRTADKAKKKAFFSLVLTLGYCPKGKSRLALLASSCIIRLVKVNSENSIKVHQSQLW